MRFHIPADCSGLILRWCFRARGCEVFGHKRGYPSWHNTVWFLVPRMDFYAASFMSKKFIGAKNLRCPTCFMLVNWNPMRFGWVPIEANFFIFNLKQPTNLTPNLGLHFDVINNMYKSAAGAITGWPQTGRGRLLQPSAIKKYPTADYTLQSRNWRPIGKVTTSQY